MVYLKINKLYFEMTHKTIFLISVIFLFNFVNILPMTEAAKHKTPFKMKITTTTLMPEEIPENKTILYRAPDIVKVPEIINLSPKNKMSSTPITPQLVADWAAEISKKLFHVEEQVVKRKAILDNFKDIKRETRDGSAIVEKVAVALEELLEKRVQAAENIAREAERIAARKPIDVPYDYIFDNSIDLEELKKFPSKPESEWELPLNCSSTRKIPLKNSTHFGTGTMVELDISSVKVAAEVFDCDPSVLKHVYWSEELIHTFRRNYAQDAMTDFQYFCSAKGFLRHYPAASWESMFKLKLGEEGDGPADVYDCRLRPWYVAASGAPRDVLVLYDATGSMNRTTNNVHAVQFTLALLSALTDDDQVNVLRFNLIVESPISCFNDKMIPANHVNSAAMMAALNYYEVTNTTNMSNVLRESVKLLHREQRRTDKPRACQQAIVLLIDAVEENYTEIMQQLDPSGKIRLFVMWLHDPFGLKDGSLKYSEWLACDRDGYFTELTTDSDVTEQVMQILRVLERPLVHQRKERLRVFSDVYAHIEDPRRSEYYWQTKERDEQAYRYRELRRNKEQFLSPKRMYDDYMHQQSLDLYGYYYEGVELDYRLQISVSVPVFDDTTVENITIKLPEELQRNATRTYPVNRLLGVAGVDIPVEHLKLMLPYYQVGAGGSLFIIDHRGNIVLHENLKPLFDGDILRPGYRTVDILDLEQSAHNHPPRNYSKEWLDFRQDLVIEQSRGSREMYAKYVFENGMRAALERREYHWMRVHNHYTVVVSLPKYNKRHAVPDSAFTQELAAKAKDAFRSELTVHPDWLYCKHVDKHFADPEFEVRHFISRRAEEPDFKMQNLNHRFSSLRTTLLEKTYMCNEDLMARVCAEALATQQWAEEHESTRKCTDCELGSITAFFASENGLTRWQQYRVASAHAEPPEGGAWPRGPEEAWYKRAVTAPGLLVVHAPVVPVRRMRKGEEKPPKLKTNEVWLTAARTLGTDKGMIGVAGYHFYPKHLEDVLRLTTDLHCDADDDCAPHCDGENWACVLIDDEGWVVAGSWRDEEETSPEDPSREHLARLYPHAMRALLNAEVFQLNWIHDNQAICFPPEVETVPKKKSTSSAQIMPSIISTVIRSLAALIHVTRELVAVLALMSTGGLVSCETQEEIQKRRNALKRNWLRERFDSLYDDRVLVNRTRFAACDRSRPLYVLQRTPKAMEILKRKPQNCTWPLTGQSVPNTNLILLAINRLCPHDLNNPIPDPLVNLPVDMHDPSWEPMPSASRLACWRNKVPLASRASHTACYPHNYTEEKGYRQCGAWKPDPPENSAANHFRNTHMLKFIFALITLIHFVL